MVLWITHALTFSVGEVGGLHSEVLLKCEGSFLSYSWSSCEFVLELFRSLLHQWHPSFLLLALIPRQKQPIWVFLHGSLWLFPQGEACVLLFRGFCKVWVDSGSLSRLPICCTSLQGPNPHWEYRVSWQSIHSKAGMGGCTLGILSNTCGDFIFPREKEIAAVLSRVPVGHHYLQRTVFSIHQNLLQDPRWSPGSTGRTEALKRWGVSLVLWEFQLCLPGMGILLPTQL